MDILDTEDDKLLNIFLITFQNCIPSLQSFKKVARVIYNMFEGIYQKKQVLSWPDNLKI